MEVLSVKDALAIMNSGEKFSVKFVTYDANRRRGGKIRYYPVVKLSTKDDEKEVRESKRRKSVKPNHFEHATRSIVIFNGNQNTGTVKKFHIYLLLEVNGIKVVL